MDRTAEYRLIARRLIEDYARYKPSNGQIETEVVIDPERDHYELMHVGWDGERRIHGSVIHLDIRGGKVWIQHNGTSCPIADELMAAGVARQDIVLGFHPARVRHLTEFAVG